MRINKITKHQFTILGVFLLAITIITVSTMQSATAGIIIEFDVFIEKECDEKVVIEDLQNPPQIDCTIDVWIGDDSTELTDCTLTDTRTGLNQGSFNLPNKSNDKLSFPGSYTADLAEAKDSDGFNSNKATIECTTQEEKKITEMDEFLTKVIAPGIEITKECREFVDEADGVDKIEFTWKVTNNSPDMASGLFSVATDGKITCPNGDMIDPFTPDVNAIGALVFGGMDGDSFVIDASLCNGATGDYTNDIDVVGLDQLNNEYTDDAFAICNIPERGEQGCTPGYWKANAEFTRDPANAWTTEMPTETLGDAGFLPNSHDLDTTLLEALALPGGDGTEGMEGKLLRHCVAAKLNAENGNVDYGPTAEEVIEICNATMATEDKDTMENLKDQLEEMNDAFCPIDMFDNPTGIE